MPFSWGAAARGGSDALEQLLAEHYAKTQEAEQVARELARDAENTRRWQQTFNADRSDAAALAMRQAAQDAIAADERKRIGTERALALSQRNNAIGMAQRAAAGQNAGTLTPRQAALEAAGQGIELPEALTTGPERRLINTLGPRGELVPRALTDEDIEAGAEAGTLKGYVAPREPRQGPTPNTVTLYRSKPGGGIENIDVTEGPEANKMYAQGWTKAAQKDVAANDEAKDTAAEVQRMSGELARHKGFGGTFGKWSSSNPKLTSSQDTVDARRILGSLTGLLTLENMNKMKGVLSDSDMEILRSASSILADELSEDAARTELNRLGRVMSKVTGNAWTEIETPGPAGYRPGAPLGAGSPAQNRPAAPPKVGDRRTINGAVGVWDGQGWAPE